MTTPEQIKQKQKQVNQMLDELNFSLPSPQHIKNVLDEVDKIRVTINEMVEDLESQNTPSEYGWKPEYGDCYWYVTHRGGVIEEDFCGDDIDSYNLSIGNCFETREQAKKYKLRLESMKPKYLPQLNQGYWFVDTFKDGHAVNGGPWRDDEIDQERYLLGRTFQTELEAQDWITNYAKAWEI